MKGLKFKIYSRAEVPIEFFDNLNEKSNWRYGYLKKSHYAIDLDNNILFGCLNLIFLSIYNGVYLFYLDTIEVKEKYRRFGIGTKLIKYIINELKRKYKSFNIFLLVAKCIQYKLKFFTTLNFVPIKLRKTENGLHCIMSFPFNEKAEVNCKRMFEYFNWREERRDYLASDCIFAHNQNPTGLYWCDKKKIYVTCLEKKSCSYYQQSKDIYFEEKFQKIKKNYLKRKL
ncbi:MAG: GNAT family N-acetyltransferase [Promethearchaeota archaeon]